VLIKRVGPRSTGQMKLTWTSPPVQSGDRRFSKNPGGWASGSRAAERVEQPHDAHLDDAVHAAGLAILLDAGEPGAAVHLHMLQFLLASWENADHV
jgi:hypothetical protein